MQPHATMEVGVATPNVTSNLTATIL